MNEEQKKQLLESMTTDELKEFTKSATQAVSSQNQALATNLIKTFITGNPKSEIIQSSNGNDMIPCYISVTDDNGNRFFGNCRVMNKKQGKEALQTLLE